MTRPRLLPPDPPPTPPAGDILIHALVPRDGVRAAICVGRDSHATLRIHFRRYSESETGRLYPKSSTGLSVSSHIWPQIRDAIDAAIARLS